MKSAATKAGGLGTGISGSGPSIFTLSKGEQIAKNVEKAIQNVYSETDISFNTYMCKINTEGIKIL